MSRGVIFSTNGAQLAAGATAASIGIPVHPGTNADGSLNYPTEILVTATGAGAFIKLGIGSATATGNDLLVQPGDAARLALGGADTLSALAVGTSSNVSVQALSTGSRNAGFTPRNLFTSGAQGVWFDPSDFSTLFQDAAGTTPVTAVGQPVGKILDKSGKGSHATQSTTTLRPLLQQDASGFYYLSFDGVDDCLATGSINFTGTSKMTLCAGVMKIDDGVRAVAELSASSDTNNGTFYLVTSSAFSARSKGTINADVNPAAIASPAARVITVPMDIAAPSVDMRLNGVSVGPNTASQGTGNYGNYPLYIGSRGGTSTLAYSGRLYGLVVVGAAQSAANLTLAERSVGSKMGIAL